jgi:hypothetical protein
LDKGEGYKGTLTYTAEFIPALNVRNIAFGEESQPQKQIDRFSVHSNDSRSSSDHEVRAVPQDVTIEVTEMGNQRIAPDSAATSTPPPVVDGNGTSAGNGVAGVDGNPVSTSEADSKTPTSGNKPEAQEKKGVELSTEEALSHRRSFSFEAYSGSGRLTWTSHRIWNRHIQRYLW